jgi:DNA-binding transcriptional MerR regulator
MGSKPLQIENSFKETASLRGRSKDESVTQHRSGAVARLLRMPVSTLRVWERRYGLTQAVLSPGGQRLYSAADVRRLALLKQLTELGHAIGSLARLDMQQLKEVAATRTGEVANDSGYEPQPDNPAPARLCRVAVIGTALAPRLQRPELLRRLARPVQWLGPFDDVPQAAAALQGVVVDVMLLHEPRLHPGWLDALQAAAPTLTAVPRAVLFRFAAESTCAALAAAGITMLREPQNDTVVGQWLHGVLSAASQAQPAARTHALAGRAPAPRRWNDGALAEFAGLASTIACECPRQVAELLMQLAQFEEYSTECEHRSAADAEIHRYLRQVAGAARVRFEAALEHVALFEGMMLPPDSPAQGIGARPVP